MIKTDTPRIDRSKGLKMRARQEITNRDYRKE